MGGVRAVKGRISWTCDACGKNFDIYRGYLSRLVLKTLIDRLLGAENHKCKEHQ